jgi:putative tryptophan/tyrosine transport system substrate-binding protein
MRARRGLGLALALGGGVLAASGVAEAQRSGSVHRIGFLGMDSRMQVDYVVAFREGLEALGHVEGHNVLIEYRWAEGRFDRLPSSPRSWWTSTWR